MKLENSPFMVKYGKEPKGARGGCFVKELDIKGLVASLEEQGKTEINISKNGVPDPEQKTTLNNVEKVFWIGWCNV